MFPTNSEWLVGISDAFSAFCLRVSVIFPTCSLYPNKRVPYTLRYTRRHGHIYIEVHARRHFPSAVPWISEDRLFNLVLHQDVVLVWLFRALVGMVVATESASVHWHNKKCSILLTLRALKVWIQQTLAHVCHRRFLVILWEGGTTGPPCCLQYGIHWCAHGNSCWGAGRTRTVCTKARGVYTSSVQNISNPSGSCTLWNGSIRLLITNKQMCFRTPKTFCSANIFSNSCNHTVSRHYTPAAP